MIFGRRNVRSGTSLPINLFVKYDELEAIPQIKSILIDGVPICVTGTTSQPVGVMKQNEVSTSSPPQSGLVLSDLPFQQFPSVTQIPAQVNNVSWRFSFGRFRYKIHFILEQLWVWIVRKFYPEQVQSRCWGWNGSISVPRCDLSRSSLQMWRFTDFVDDCYYRLPLRCQRKSRFISKGRFSATAWRHRS